MPALIILEADVIRQVSPESPERRLRESDEEPREISEVSIRLSYLSFYLKYYFIKKFIFLNYFSGLFNRYFFNLKRRANFMLMLSRFRLLQRWLVQGILTDGKAQHG